MRKSFWVFMACMLLLLAFGVMTVAYGVKTYQNRPLLPQWYGLEYRVV